eukprot:INCI20231.1.p1 GENE.INCI20231.1~~INCI20231.1.p1  ORF type:complete len:406 (+),score=76.56 INCI20231.1:206-1423(+)
MEWLQNARQSGHRHAHRLGKVAAAVIMSAAVNTQFVDGADCGETCLGRPCNYWVDEDMASCAELLHVSSCSGCEECTVCAGAPSDDNFVVVALGVFCGVLSVVVIIMMVFVCLRSRNTLSGQDLESIVRRGILLQDDELIVREACEDSSPSSSSSDSEDSADDDGAAKSKHVNSGATSSGKVSTPLLSEKTMSRSPSSEHKTALGAAVVQRQTAQQQRRQPSRNLEAKESKTVALNLDTKLNKQGHMSLTSSSQKRIPLLDTSGSGDAPAADGNAGARTPPTQNGRRQNAEQVSNPDRVSTPTSASTIKVATLLSSPRTGSKVVPEESSAPRRGSTRGEKLLQRSESKRRSSIESDSSGGSGRKKKKKKKKERSSSSSTGGDGGGGSGTGHTGSLNVLNGQSGVI